MKTNQIMIRDDYRFIQRTKDGYFDAKNLLDKWNELQPYKSRLLLANYQKNKSTKEFIKQLKSEGIENPVISARGRNGGTWVHPKIMIDFTMWVDVKFKSIVIDYILDGLMKSRHNAGDNYNNMCAEILKSHLKHYGTKPKPTLYIDEAKRIKSILKVSSINRNDMSETQLNDISQLQKLNTFLLAKNIGFASRVKKLKEQAEFMAS